MQKLLVVSLCLLALSFGRELTPKVSIDTKYEVVSINVQNKNLFVSTTQGALLVYDIADLDSIKLTQKIVLPPYEDFFGNSYKPKIYNSATNANGDILIVSANAQATRDLSLYKNGSLELVINDKNIAKAVWFSPTQVLIGFLSHEVGLFDFQRNSFVFQTHITQASFSDMFYNNKDEILYTTGESGVIYVINPRDGAILNKFSNFNKDKVFCLAFGGGKLVSAGNDRLVGIYNLISGKELGGFESVRSDFLVYSVGISEDGQRIAYMGDERGNVYVLDSVNKQRVLLTGIDSVVNGIFFYQDFVVVSSDSSKIYFFKI